MISAGKYAFFEYGFGMRCKDRIRLTSEYDASMEYTNSVVRKIEIWSVGK